MRTPTKGQRVLVRQDLSRRQVHVDGHCYLTGDYASTCDCKGGTKNFPGTVDTVYRKGRKWWVTLDNGRRLEMSARGVCVAPDVLGHVFVPSEGRGDKARWVAPHGKRGGS